MPDFLTLSCPSCGSKLKLIDGVNLLVCVSCGNEHMVHRDGGSIYLAPMAQDMRQIRVGTDKTAAELAVVRLTKELADIKSDIAATRERRYNVEVRKSALGGWLVMGAILALVLTVFGLIVSLWLAVFSMFVFLVLGVWYLYESSKWFMKAQKKEDRLKQGDLDRLLMLSKAKWEALAKNQMIANS